MNTKIPDSLGEQQDWSAAALVAEPEKHSRLVQWWYSQTSLPDPPPNASFVQREAARKSHLLSTIIFWLVVVFILFLPACFALPNQYVVYADLGMIVFCLIAIMLNRAQKPQAAGILLTIGFELALTMVIFTTLPLDEPSIQQYELFVFGELLCVSLLTPGYVFIVMLYNIAIIASSLFLQPHTIMLAQDLQTQWAPMLIRPLGVQSLVAFVSWLWVKSASKAIARADRAETIAKLEHELADQKQKMEGGIQEILRTHVEVANGNLSARAPLTQDNVLWQIARALNTLLVRLQRSALAEHELHQVKQAVQTTVQTIQDADMKGQPPSVPFTGTDIDPLIVAIQGKSFTYTTHPMGWKHQPSQERKANAQQPNPFFRQ